MGLLGALATVVFREPLSWIQVVLGERTRRMALVHLARGLESRRLLLPAAGGALAGLVLHWPAGC